MGRSRNRKRAAKSVAGTTAIESTSTGRSWWTKGKLAAAATLGVTLIGLISALMSFQTKFVVSLGEAVTPDDFESLPFEFVNDSPYAVDWVRHNCVIYAARLKNGTHLEGLQSFPAFHRRQRIESGQGRTVFCVITGKNGTKVEAADIGLRVAYKPWFSPVEQAKEYRFDILTDPTGKLRGLRKPSADYELAP